MKKHLVSWFHCAVGVFVIAAPWVVGMGDSVIAWLDAFAGVLLVLVNLWIIFVRDAEPAQ